MPVTAAEEWTHWDTKATELRRTQLATVQAAATKWIALLTAFLGIFGAVAFAGGLTTIDKLAEPFSTIAKVVTTLAAVTDLIAIYLFNKAAGGLSPTYAASVTASSVRDAYTTGAGSVLSTFKTARIFAVLVVVLVFLGSLMVLWAGEAEAKGKVPSVVAAHDGQLVCGQLGRSDGSLTIAGEPVGGDVTFLTPVTACP